MADFPDIVRRLSRQGAHQALFLEIRQAGVDLPVGKAGGLDQIRQGPGMFGAFRGDHLPQEGFGMVLGGATCQPVPQIGFHEPSRVAVDLAAHAGEHQTHHVQGHRAVEAPCVVDPVEPFEQGVKARGVQVPSAFGKEILRLLPVIGGQFKGIVPGPVGGQCQFEDLFPVVGAEHQQHTDFRKRVRRQALDHVGKALAFLRLMEDEKFLKLINHDEQRRQSPAFAGPGRADQPFHGGQIIAAAIGPAMAAVIEGPLEGGFRIADQAHRQHLPALILQSRADARRHQGGFARTGNPGQVEQAVPRAAQPSERILKGPVPAAEPLPVLGPIRVETEVTGGRLPGHLGAQIKQPLPPGPQRRGHQGEQNDHRQGRQEQRPVEDRMHRAPESVELVGKGEQRNERAGVSDQETRKHHGLAQERAEKTLPNLLAVRLRWLFHRHEILHRLERPIRHTVRRPSLMHTLSRGNLRRKPQANQERKEGVSGAYRAAAAFSTPGSFRVMSISRTSWRAATWLMVMRMSVSGSLRSSRVRPMGNISR